MDCENHIAKRGERGKRGANRVLKLEWMVLNDRERKLSAGSRNGSLRTRFKPSFAAEQTSGDLPFAFRALLEAEFQFGHLVLLGRVKVILGGEGEVGGLEQIAPCQREECKEEKER